MRSAAIALAIVLGTACSGGSASHTASPATTSTTAPRPTSAIAWSHLRNPLFASKTYAAKDPALVDTGDGWVALYSRVDASGTWRIGLNRSRDLVAWSLVGAVPHDPAIPGEASPDVVRAPDGAYVVTYQSSTRDRAGAQSKLYARTTRDFHAFSAPIRLLANLHNAPGDRLIDAALVYSPAGLLLGYKLGTTDPGSVQHFELARSPSGRLSGPWQLIGRPNIVVYRDTIEIYQFLPAPGSSAPWQLLATSNQFDRPELFTLRGDPATASGWLDWSPARTLAVPQESWNDGKGITGATYEHANSAFLVDRRAVDGYAYLVYEDAPDMSTFGGQGHGRLALARSQDLVHWVVPPG